MKKPIKLFKSRNINGEFYILNEGQKVTLIGTDNKEWFLIKSSTGKRGWFAIDGYYNIRNEGVIATEIFAGLCFTD